jgi:uroporphyrinogen-III decarboxylase
MTKRNIIKTLLNKQLPERVGLNESFWPFIVENAWEAQGIAAGTDFVRRFNLDLPIILHTCGDFRPHIESIIESGVDCIQALEAKTGMNVVKLAEQYKDRLCFMGNIDVRALESGDRKRIQEECLGKLNGMKALRAPYVFMSDHSIPPSVTVADYEFMLELFWKNCRY